MARTLRAGPSGRGSRHSLLSVAPRRPSSECNGSGCAGPVTREPLAGKTGYRIGGSAGELVDGAGERRGGPVEEDLGFRPHAVAIERGDDQVKRPALREGVEVAAASGRERHGGQRLSHGVDRRRGPGPDAELEGLRQQFGSATSTSVPPAASLPAATKPRSSSSPVEALRVSSRQPAWMKASCRD